jgi:hypothetical protein
MTKRYVPKALLAALGASALIALGGVAANADSGRNDGYHGGDRGNDRGLHLSNRPKEIVIDNLDNFAFTKGDPQQAAHAQEVCGDCHSTDYPATQPKLSCAGWGNEIVKMGNTMGAVTPWQEDGVDKAALRDILHYLADNYGDAAGAAGCMGTELDALPLN